MPNGFNPLYPTVVVPTHTPPVQISLAGTMVFMVECSIAAGTSMSTAIDMTQPSLQGFNPLAVFIPSAWTTADLSFQASWDGSNFGELHTFSAGAIHTSANAVANDVLVLDNYHLRGIPFFRIRSGQANNPVNQVAARTVKVLCGTY